MVTIKSVRPVILTGKYGFTGCAENQIHLPEGLRCCSMVEITLSNGLKGIGEGYLGVFAPDVFSAIVRLIAPTIVGCDLSSGYLATVKKAKNITAYWSLQGAAQHVISAIEIALVDVFSKYKEVPAIALFGGAKKSAIAMYGSGGDSLHPVYMAQELKQLAERGIKTIKIRSRVHQVEKAVWTIKAAKQYGIGVAVDMTQNLAVDGQTPEEVVSFCEKVYEQTGERLVFVEECLGLDKLTELPRLSLSPDIQIAGGEIVTTKQELFERIDSHYYNIVQPDASVIGGIKETIDVCQYAQGSHTKAVVHSWGGPVAMMANYIAAFASDCELIEYPMPNFELRHALFDFESYIQDGKLTLPEKVGIGIELNEEVEKEFAYQESAVYHCIPLASGLEALEESHSNWKEGES
ncbi:enolase C-terminal domain-like protein [Vibrio nomapromontoriensis]|uniref:enolase C-terminal domain-like protein n=1 Tax=Vibrio nomapromontoriensis TaxID=2910246 RepID=UPI003D133B71